MEKRIGAIIILIQNRDHIAKLNQIFSKHASIILARQGLPLTHKNINVISLIVEGTTDQIGSLTGQIGRLDGLQVKSVLTKYKEDDHESTKESFD